MTLSPIVEFAPFRLDLIDERLWRGQEVRPLTPKAFAVLRCLVAHPDQLVTKDTLMDTVWPETAISESTLTGCIWEVRQALGDSARHPHYLETVHGRGYRFIALVTELAAPEIEPPAAVEQPQVSPVPALPVAYLVGREAELAQLVQWYETARQGQRQVGLIGGNPALARAPWWRHSSHRWPPKCPCGSPMGNALSSMARWNRICRCWRHSAVCVEHPMETRSWPCCAR